MASVQPQLWVSAGRAAVAFYTVAFGATVEHLVGDGDDIVAQLSVGDGAFWIASADVSMGRLTPSDAGGSTGRMLLVVTNPDAVVETAVAAGARLTSPVGEAHGWRLGRIVDPFGHEWEIGRPS